MGFSALVLAVLDCYVSQRAAPQHILISCALFFIVEVELFIGIIRQDVVPCHPLLGCAIPANTVALLALAAGSHVLLHYISEKGHYGSLQLQGTVDCSA